VFTAMGMQRFPVTWWGKTGTFLLMFALPGLLLGASDVGYADAVTTASWVLGVPGLFISWYAAFTYVPTMRVSLAEGRRARRSAT
jgi:cardiolipin synthase